jgi:hypothetical protein
MYPALIGVAISWPEWNALRPLLFSNAAFAGIFWLQVSGAPGSTVVPSHGSPANLAGISELRSVVVGLQMWESRSDFQAWRLCQASCAGHQAAITCGNDGGR